MSNQSACAPSTRAARHRRSLRRPIVSLSAATTARRWLTKQDDTLHGPALLVSESFVVARLSGRDPIGQRVQFEPEGPWSTIVGVVGDVRYHSRATVRTGDLCPAV